MQLQQIYIKTDLKSGLTTIERGQESISFDPDDSTSIASALKTLGARHRRRIVSNKQEHINFVRIDGTGETFAAPPTTKEQAIGSGMGYILIKNNQL